MRIAKVPATPPPIAPSSPYPPTKETPVPTTNKTTDAMRAHLVASRQEIESLQDRCRRFEQRLQLAEQDRELLEQRVDLFREQLERCEQELDQSSNKPAIEPEQPKAPPAMYRPAPPRLSTPQKQSGDQARLDSANRLRAQPQQQLIFTDGNLRDMLDEWERYWFLDQPDNTTPFRVHGGGI